MKRLIQCTTLAATVALVGANAFAASLKTVMEEMGKDFKALGRQISDPAQNQSSLQLAEDLASLIEESSKMTPDSIHAMPASQRPAAKAEYDKLMAQLLADDKDLIVQLHAGNQAGAIAAAKRMNAGKKDGHDQFK